MMVSRLILHRMRNVADKSCGENQTHLLCSITPFRKSGCLGDNVEKYCRARQATDNNTIRRLHLARWIPKATHNHNFFPTAIVVTRKLLVVTL
jgi:hypothetical protein